MRCAAAAVVALLGACGGPKIQDRSVGEMTKYLPATLEAERPREGDPRTAKVHVWVDAGIRANKRWKDEITDQIDYANQLLTPLVGLKLSVESIEDWDRAGDPSGALQQLVELDKADDAMWVIGYVTAGDTATKVLSDLASAEPLGRHVIVRGWAEKAETAQILNAIPDVKEAERSEMLSAHRRHKQTVVLVSALATTLGAIAETEPAQLKHAVYSPKQTSFSERNRELIQIALDERLGAGTPQTAAKKLVDAIEKTPWGGWVTADHDHVVSRLRNVLDAAKAGKTAAEVPPAAYDQYTRIRELAKRKQTKDALVELENLLTAYPGNAAMHQLRCDIMIGAPGVADKTTRAACTRASELAPGDPGPHLSVGEALAKTDIKAARAELAIAEGKISNLPNGTEAWRRLIDVYHSIGSLTWTEDAIAKAKLGDDPVAVKVGQTRARYGVPRGTKLVTPEREAELVAAVRNALNLIYASKYGEAERALAASERKWPGAAGLAGARCDLLLRTAQIDGARAACARALAVDPKASWALYLSGVLALREAGTTKAGIEKLKLAIEVDPELGQAWRTLAKAYTREKDKAALEQLAKDYQLKFGQALPP